MRDDVAALRMVALLAWRVIRKAEGDRVTPAADSGCTWTLDGAGYPTEFYALARALDDLSEIGIVHLPPLIQSDDQRQAQNGRP